METDREILIWFHQRLCNRHGESELYDYMHRLRWIIYAMPKNKMSRGEGVKQTCNGADELLKILRSPSQFEQDLLKEERPAKP